MNPTVVQRGAFALAFIAVLAASGCKESSAPPAATKLAFTGQPSNMTSKAPMTVQVTVQDALGNTVTSANDNITLAIGTNPGSGTLSGTAMVAAVNGVATSTTWTSTRRVTATR